MYEPVHCATDQGRTAGSFCSRSSIVAAILGAPLAGGGVHVVELLVVRADRRVVQAVRERGRVAASARGVGLADAPQQRPRVRTWAARGANGRIELAVGGGGVAGAGGQGDQRVAGRSTARPTTPAPSGARPTIGSSARCR